MPIHSDLHSSFEKLFRDHYQSLANYAYSFLGDRDSAEDVVQDVFVRLWQNKPDIIQSAEAKFYLLTATKNGCISFLRKNAGKVFVQPEDAHLSDLADSTPDNKLTDIKSVVQQALDALPPQCLAVFKLSRFGKLTYQQIADELGISGKTVENHMGKALRIMRDYARKNNISFALLLIFLSSPLSFSISISPFCQS